VRKAVVILVISGLPIPFFAFIIDKVLLWLLFQIKITYLEMVKACILICPSCSLTMDQVSLLLRQRILGGCLLQFSHKLHHQLWISCSISNRCLLQFSHKLHHQLWISCSISNRKPLTVGSLPLSDPNLRTLDVFLFIYFPTLDLDNCASCRSI